MVRTILGILLALVLLAACASVQESPAGTPAGKVNWLSLAEGKKVAMAEKKPMVVDFFVPEGCPRCDLMGITYKNPDVIRKLNTEFVPIRVDLSRALTKEEDELGRRYGYNFECLLLFLDYEGNVVEDTFGRKLCFVTDVDVEWFLKYLDLTAEMTRKKAASEPPSGN